MKNTNTGITVYTYGRKHTFPNMGKAKREVLKWMAGSEGCEKERYTQVYLMLEEGKTVAYDCDGIAKPRPKLKPLTDAERKEWKRRAKENEARGDKLDALRAKYEAKKAELLKAIQPLKDEIDAHAKKWNDEAVAMIAYERREAA